MANMLPPAGAPALYPIPTKYHWPTTLVLPKRNAKAHLPRPEPPEWRRGRTRDLVAAREVLIELMPKFYRGAATRRVDREALFADEPAFRTALAEMPSFDVAVTMKTAYHRDGTHRWTANDINDIDILGSTLPYCDVVVTDKAVAAHATRSGLAERLSTVVLARLEDLLPLL